MRELLLLRHAEAVPAGPGGHDNERPLSARGKGQAEAVGAWLAAAGAAPDTVLCSPACRCRMTARAAGKMLPMPGPRFLSQVYGATPGKLLALVDEHASESHRALLIGHNPGLEGLLAVLTQGRGVGRRRMAPASLAWIDLADGKLEPGRGHLRHFWSR